MYTKIKVLTFILSCKDHSSTILFLLLQRGLEKKMVKMAGMCLLSSTATEESRVEALEVVLETVQVEEKPFRALLRKLCKPPMRAEDSTGWNNKEKSSNNPCTCPPPTYNSKFFFLLLHTHHGRMRVSVFYYRVLVSLTKRVYLARLNSFFFS